MSRPVHKPLITPGSVLQGLTIIGNVEDREQIAVCRVPVGEGATCGHPFFEGEERAFEEHMRTCVDEHMDAIMAESPRAKMPVFDEDEWDPEAAAYLRKVGETMLREGRLETRPNERLNG